MGDDADWPALGAPSTTVSNGAWGKPAAPKQVSMDMTAVQKALPGAESSPGGTSKPPVQINSGHPPQPLSSLGTLTAGPSGRNKSSKAASKNQPDTIASKPQARQAKKTEAKVPSSQQGPSSSQATTVPFAPATSSQTVTANHRLEGSRAEVDSLVRKQAVGEVQWGPEKGDNRGADYSEARLLLASKDVYYKNMGIKAAAAKHKVNLADLQHYYNEFSSSQLFGDDDDDDDDY